MMNVHHLYVMFQGLVALYFVAVVIPSVGIIIYQAPSAAVPTSFTESLTLISPINITSLREFPPSHNEEDSSTPILSIHVDDSGQNETPPTQLTPPPTVHFQREDSGAHSILLNQQKVPDLLLSPQQQRSTAVGNGFCFLALSVVLGTLGIRRLIGPRNLPHQDGDNTDSANPEWGRSVFLPPITADEPVNNQRLEISSISKTHARDILTRPRCADIKPVYPTPSLLSIVPPAAPSAYGPSIRNNTKVRNVSISLSKDSHSNSQTTTSSTTVLPATGPTDRLASTTGAQIGVFGRAPDHVWDIRSPRASKPLSISVFKDVESGVPTCDGPSTIPSLPLIPPRERPSVGPDAGPNFPIAAPVKTTFYVKPPYINYKKRKAVKPLAVNTLNDFKDTRTSTTALSRVQSYVHSDGNQSLPFAIETVRYVASQTESSTQYLRKDTHFFEDPIDFSQTTISPPIVQPTIDSENWSSFPVIVSTENTILGSTRRTFDADNFIATDSIDQPNCKHNIASVMIKPAVPRSANGDNMADSFLDRNTTSKSTSPDTSILDVISPISVNACKDVLNDGSSTKVPLINSLTVSSTAALSPSVSVQLEVCKTSIKHKQTNNRISKSVKPASVSTSVRQPANICQPEVPLVPEFGDVFYNKCDGSRPEIVAQSDTFSPENPSVIENLKEDTGELSKEAFDQQTSNHDMIIDMTLEEITPIHATKPSSFPALFGPNAVKFPSAALDLATLLSSPPVWIPWKFEELMPAPDAPCTGPTGTMDQSSHGMDADMDCEPYRPKENTDWDAYDKAFAKQELRWRTIIQSHPPKDNFWSQYPPASSQGAW